MKITERTKVMQGWVKAKLTTGQTALFNRGQILPIGCEIVSASPEATEAMRLNLTTPKPKKAASETTESKEAGKGTEK